MEFRPHDYQQQALQWVLDKPKTGLFIPMGKGKTSVTLTAIEQLLYDCFQVDKVLIIAPIRVAQSTWPDEIAKWDHTRKLTYSVAVGSEPQRRTALESDADIYLINRENVMWLVENYGQDWKWDMVVIDELSSFKNPSAKRFKALKKIMPLVTRFVGLTGTPTPKGMPDLWSQVYLMDAGERLGKTIKQFQRNYLIPGQRNGFVVYNWTLQENAERRITDKISDICMSLEPSPTEAGSVSLVHSVELPLPVFCQYKRFKREKIIELANDDVITAANAGVITNKLLQFTAGAVYDEGHKVQLIHDVKLDALEDLMESANGEPVIVYYYFKHDYDRIYQRFNKFYKIRAIDSPQDVLDWNKGKIDMLLVHPASVGHGLNLQDGGSIEIWYSLPNWNLELYQQANARLDRQGQKHTVRIYHIIAKGTIDEDMMQSLENKKVTQDGVMQALRLNEVAMPSKVGKEVYCIRGYNPIRGKVFDRLAIYTKTVADADYTYSMTDRHVVPPECVFDTLAQAKEALMKEQGYVEIAEE